MSTDFKISLAAARVNKGLSQGEVADMLKKSKSTIVAWENGRAKISGYDLAKMCDLYGVPMDYIFLPDTATKSSD
jgi:transcriptional regulator with XRE-family HTH domain